MSTRPVELVRRGTNEFVPAELHDQLRPEDLLLVERAWVSDRARLMGELFKLGVPRKEWPESLHWDWSRKAPELKLLAARGFGIVCDSQWQGVMVTKTAGHQATLGDDKGKPLVYVDFLESAPWNWVIAKLQQERRFKGIGVLLIKESVEQSIKEGFHGRVGLHALPQAEGFYEGVCKMTRVGPDHKKQRLAYFEFTRRQAEQFLTGGNKP